MTDSDRESFHSAVGSLSDLEEEEEYGDVEKQFDGKMKAVKCGESNGPVHNRSGILEWKKGEHRFEKPNYDATFDTANIESSLEREVESDTNMREMKEFESSSGTKLDSGRLSSQSFSAAERTKTAFQPDYDGNKSSKNYQKPSEMDKVSGNHEIMRDEISGVKFFEGNYDQVNGKDNMDEPESNGKKTDENQENSDGYEGGWDDWGFECTEKDDNGMIKWDIGTEEQSKRTIDKEQQRIADNPESTAEFESKQHKTNKSFWNWTEFGDVVAAVGEGITNISTVVESGLGLPTPEELAKYQWDEEKSANMPTITKKTEHSDSTGIKSYGKLFAGFGANVVTGSLDVLEALGKKTFEKLTVPEKGSEKRRFIFEPERGQNLSEVLRELRDSKAEETILENNCITKRELTFIDFFEKFSGILHLEGLEMLSKNHLRKIPPQRRREVDGIFEEDLINSLEEYPEDEEEDFVQKFKEILSVIALPYNESSLMDCHKRCKERLDRLPDSGDQIFEFFLECLADFTAQSVQSVHKMGQLLLITATAVKQKPFSQFHGLIGRQISFYSNQFAQHISAVDSSEETDELVTAVFLAAGDAFSYIQQSFRLLRPLLIL